MSITSANILARANQITRRAETDIDAKIIEALIDLSLRTGELKASVSGTVSTVDDSIDKPADFIGVDEITIDTVVYYDKITFREYLEDTKQGYAERGSKIYIAPSSTSSRAYVLYYTKYHASSVATIEFADKWFMAFVYLCASKICEDYGLVDKANEYRGKYELELLANSANDEMAIAKQ